MKNRVTLLLVLCLLCTGCSGMELGERLIIEAIGVDYEDERFLVTVQAFDTRQAGSADTGDTPENITKIYAGKGDTVAEAFSRIGLTAGQKPLYSQARVVVLGKKVAEEKLESALDFFIREYTTRDDVSVALAQDKAAEVVSADLGKSVISAKVMQEAMESGDYNARAINMPMYTFVNYILSPTDAAFAPVIAIIKNEKDESEISIPGTAVFADSSLTTVLTDEQTAGLLWATNRVKNGTLHVSLDDRTVALDITQVKTKLDVVLTGEQPVFTLQCTLACDIVEYDGSLRENTDKEKIRKLEQAASLRIHEDIVAMLRATAFDKGCDILRFGRLLMQKDTALYDDFEKNRTQRLHDAQISLHVKATVRRTGRETFLDAKS